MDYLHFGFTTNKTAASWPPNGQGIINPQCNIFAQTTLLWYKATHKGDTHHLIIKKLVCTKKITAKIQHAEVIINKLNHGWKPYTKNSLLYMEKYNYSVLHSSEHQQSYTAIVDKQSGV